MELSHHVLRRQTGYSLKLSPSRSKAVYPLIHPFLEVHQEPCWLDLTLKAKRIKLTSSLKVSLPSLVNRVHSVTFQFKNVLLLLKSFIFECTQCDLQIDLSLLVELTRHSTLQEDSAWFCTSSCHNSQCHNVFQRATEKKIKTEIVEGYSHCSQNVEKKPKKKSAIKPTIGT